MALPADIDHLVFACADLERGMDWAERTFGVRPARGGAHPQWGTRNALLALGRERYLEILAPDPEAAPAGRANAAGRALFGLSEGMDPSAPPRLSAWMLRTRTIDNLLAAALRAGCDLGRVAAGSRLRADGSELSWQIAAPPARVLGGTVPWLIDWGWSEHPAADLPMGVRLDWLEIAHPEPERVRAVLEALNCGGIEVRAGREPAITAGCACPRGVVVV